MRQNEYIQPKKKIGGRIFPPKFDVLLDFGHPGPQNSLSPQSPRAQRESAPMEAALGKKKSTLGRKSGQSRRFVDFFQKNCLPANQGA